MENETLLLENYFPGTQLDLLRRAAAISARERAELYVVGGTVRDILSGVMPIDLDLVWVGGTGRLAEALVEELGGKILSVSEFGTAKLSIQGGIIDLAAARSETYKRPGALPTVVPGTIDEDLARRDFSVNAMAIFLQKDDRGVILDPHRGLDDLEQKIIRVLHSRSFSDDPTRILRALRYAHRLGFQYEDETAALWMKGLAYLETISGDRIRRELQRMLRETDTDQLLIMAERSGVLTAIHPAFQLGREALAELCRLGACSFQRADDWLISLLLAEVSPDDASSVIDRLNLDGQQAKVVRDVIAIRAISDHFGATKIRPSQVHELLQCRDETAIEVCARLVRFPSSNVLREYLSNLRNVKPILNGDDLIELGVPKGPEIGKILYNVLTARLDGLVRTKDEEEMLVLRRLKGI